jgi:hypothetical protein
VDGDPLLTGRLNFPCPADELAEELDRIDRPLLVAAKDAHAQGNQILASQLDELAVQRIGFSDRGHVDQDRFFLLCWMGKDEEWALIEDLETTRNSKQDELQRGKV